MAGFSLLGWDSSTPIPGIVREIRFAQGDGSGVAPERKVVFVGNRTSDGSETVATLGDAIQSLSNCIDRFGQRSELTLMYRRYTEIDPDATIYAVAATEGAGAATVAFTLATNASGATTLKITVIGETIEVAVASGDTPTVVAVAAVAAINAQTHWPLTAGNVAGVVTLTAANTGSRGDALMNHARMAFSKVQGMTVVKGAVTPGGADDDHTNAITALAATEIYYHVSAKAQVAAVSTTDHGLGEHASMITTQALPANGKEQRLIAGCIGTQGQATVVAEALNNVLAHVVWAEDNDWTPAMIAAHCAAVVRANEVAHPGANITDWGKKSGQVFKVPAPYDITDRPTTTEVRSALNSGVSVLNFTHTGQGYIQRCVTSYSFIGSNTTRDYRCREGHIPSAIHYFWSQVRAAYASQAQPFVASDPAEGEKPLPGVTYPSAVKAIIAQKMRAGATAKEFSSGPYLDPSVLDKMLASIQVVGLQDGVSAKASPVAVRHNLKAAFLIEEASGAY